MRPSCPPKYQKSNPNAPKWQPKGSKMAPNDVKMAPHGAERAYWASQRAPGGVREGALALQERPCNETVSKIAIWGTHLGAPKCSQSDENMCLKPYQIREWFLDGFREHFGGRFDQQMVQIGAAQRIRGVRLNFEPLLKIYRNT